MKSFLKCCLAMSALHLTISARGVSGISINKCAQFEYPIEGSVTTDIFDFALSAWSLSILISIRQDKISRDLRPVLSTSRGTVCRRSHRF